MKNISVKLILSFFLIFFFTTCESFTINKNERHRQLQPRISNGRPAKPHEFPYQVALEIRKLPVVTSTCGGSLISTRYVLTAAHCIYSNAYRILPNFTVVMIEDFYEFAHSALVILGAHELDKNETTQQKIEVHQVGFEIHPKYNSQEATYDIGLVHLPKAAIINDYVKVVSLPSKSIGNLLKETMIVTGWGRVSDDSDDHSDVLRYVKLTVMETRLCSNYYDSIYDEFQICANGYFEKSPCQGDSGGPSVIAGKDNNTYIQVGIVSFGSVNGCEEGWPSVYTRLSYFVDWIHKETGIPIEN